MHLIKTLTDNEKENRNALLNDVHRLAVPSGLQG